MPFSGRGFLERGRFVPKKPLPERGARRCLRSGCSREKFIFAHIIVDEIIQILDKAIPKTYTLCHEEKSLVVAKPKATGFG
jgi:hypothetical protein